jgi:hypothetical protein
MKNLRLMAGEIQGSTGRSRHVNVAIRARVPNRRRDQLLAGFGGEAIQSPPL